MEIFGERFAQLSWQQQLAFGSLIVLGAGMIVGGCASSNNNANSLNQQFCRYGVLVSGSLMSVATELAVPTDGKIIVTQVKVRKTADSNPQPYVEVGEEVKTAYTDGEFADVFTIVSSIPVPDSDAALKRFADHPPVGAERMKCSWSEDITVAN